LSIHPDSLVLDRQDLDVVGEVPSHSDLVSSPHNGSVARLNRPNRRSEEALAHDTFHSTKAVFNPVVRLVANENRHKAGDSVDTIEGLGGLFNQGSTFFRADTNLNPNKITDPKPILGHTKRTSIG
jgi:hypothetical protein